MKSEKWYHHTVIWVLDFFGRSWFNAISFLMGLVGVVLGTIAIWIAIRELGKIRDAATAAKSAAEKTYNNLSSVGAIGAVARLRKRANECAAALKHQDYHDADFRCSELIEDLAEVRASAWSEGILKAEDWDNSVQVVVALGKWFRGMRDGESATLKSRQKAFANIETLRMRFSTAGATLAQKMGADYARNANSD